MLRGHRSRLLLSGCVAAVLTLCASTAGSASSPPSTDQSTDAPQTSQTDDTAEPQAGGDLVFASLYDAFGLDPVRMIGGVAGGMQALSLYDPLMTFDADGNVVPWLAESLETTDSQTWTVLLRDGITFSDGTTLDAEAVKINLDRHINPDLQSFLFANAQNIESTAVIDESTVEIVTRTPFMALPELLTGPIGMIASPDALASAPDGVLATTAAGTGPFILSEWVPGNHMLVERNPDYWRSGEPLLDSIDFRVLTDGNVRFQTVESGEAQLGFTMDGSQVQAAQSTDGMQGLPCFCGTGIIQFKTSEPPFDDQTVREAIVRAIDSEVLNSALFDGANRSPSLGLIGPASPYYTEVTSFPTYDLDVARQLVEDYESANGPINVAFSTTSSPLNTTVAAALQQMWAAAGIDVTVETMDQQQYATQVLRNGAFQMSLSSVVYANSDPALYLYSGYHSTSPTNNTKYSNPDVDAALDSAQVSTDVAERIELYRIVTDNIGADVPVAPIYTTPWGYFASEDFHGPPVGADTIIRPSLMWIAQE